MNKQDKTRYFPLIGLSALLYVISLMVPALYSETMADTVAYVGGGTCYGVGLLLCGWQGLLMFNPGWFANPCYFISLLLAFNTLVFNTHGTGGLMLSFITICIGLSSLLLYLNDKVTFYIGFYLWIASFVVLYAALFFRRKLNLRHEGEDIQEAIQT